MHLQYIHAYSNLPDLTLIQQMSSKDLNYMVFNLEK